MKKSMSKRAKLFFCLWSMLTVCVTMLTTAAFATTADPITVVNNLSDFIFSAIKDQGRRRHYPRLGHCAGGHVHPEP